MKWINLNAMTLFFLVLNFSFFSCKSDTTGKKAVESSITKQTQKTQSKEVALTWNKIDDIDKLMAQEKKKVLIDLYTSWCKWCKVMDKETFTDPKVAAFLAENYHLIKFDAEQKAPAMYKGKTYAYKATKGNKGVNSLAENLLSGKMSYPSLVFLDDKLNKVRVSRGYLKPDQLMNELKGL